ncbi:MAG: hypothetical protein OQL06_15175 [Gammaproteobacteria bacterium]|nr:hypothetical protein [Gammaproteobacteria bacterium]
MTPLSRENTRVNYYGKGWSVHDAQGLYYACIVREGQECSEENF